MDYRRNLTYTYTVHVFDVYMHKWFFLSLCKYTHTHRIKYIHASAANNQIIPSLFCRDSFYCPGNGSLSRTYECPEGHYCPSGTLFKHQYPCPAGSINPHTQMEKPQDCLPCPPGHTPFTANEFEWMTFLKVKQMTLQFRTTLTVHNQINTVS